MSGGGSRGGRASEKKRRETVGLWVDGGGGIELERTNGLRETRECAYVVFLGRR